MSENRKEDLQAAIRSKGYNWQAGKTSISELSINKQKSMLRFKVDKAEMKTTRNAIRHLTKLQASNAPLTLPSAVDWRNRNGADWTTPIKNQGNSCGGEIFAIVAALESRIKIAYNTPNLNIDLSEAHIFYCGCGNCNNTGWSIPPALDFCKNIGVCNESSFPWVPVYQPCKPGLVPIIKIKGWSQVLTVADRKNILATKGPMVAVMAIYDDFLRYRTGVYRHTTGRFGGYSSKTVVGYDDAQQCWICKNSWGTGWGENGWFKIGYGECLIDTSFSFFDIDLDCPLTTVFLIRHAEYVIDPAIPNDQLPLSPAGLSRAKQLSLMLCQTGINAVFQTQTKRSQETAQRIVDHNNLSPIIYPNVQDLISQIRTNHIGENLLVLGHEPTVPQIIQGLVPGTPSININGTFHNMFIITFGNPCKSKLEHLWYGEIPSYKENLDNHLIN